MFYDIMKVDIILIDIIKTDIILIDIIKNENTMNYMIV